MLNIFDNDRTIWQNVLIGSGLFIIFAIGFGVPYLAFNFGKIFVKNPLRQILPTPNIYAKATPKPIEQVNQSQGTYNVLLLGYGGNGHDGALLTDSIIVVHVDTNTKKTTLISVPRDLWVTGNHKINASGINNFQNTGPVVQNITGLPINYFVSVDFGGFVKIIDDLGGITVQVPKTFDDPFYPITGQENNVCGRSSDQVDTLKTQYSGTALEEQFPCRFEHLHFDMGQTNLDGTTALKFSRSRHGDSDFGRSLRQFAILAGIKNKLISLQATGKLNNIINTLSQIVKTDLDAGTIKSLITVFGDPKTYTTKQIQLTTDNVLSEGKADDGEYILYPKAGMFNYSEVQKYVSNGL